MQSPWACLSLPTGQKSNVNVSLGGSTRSPFRIRRLSAPIKLLFPLALALRANIE